MKNKKSTIVVSLIIFLILVVICVYRCNSKTDSAKTTENKENTTPHVPTTEKEAPKTSQPQNEIKSENIPANDQSVEKTLIEKLKRNNPADKDSEDKKLDAYKYCIKSINEYLASCKDEQKQKHYEELKKDYQNAEKRIEYSRKLSTLNERLEKEEIDWNTKIKEIDDFINSNKDFESEDSILDLKEKKKRFQTNRDNQRKLDELEREIEEKVTKRPDSYDMLNNYRRDCRELCNKLKFFLNDTLYKSKAEYLKRKLAGEISYVDRNIGKGSREEIRKREEIYQKHPTSENFEVLQNAINAFDPELEENSGDKNFNVVVQNRSKAYKRVIDEYNEFQKNPNNGSWTNFEAAIDDFLNKSGRENYPTVYERIYNYMNKYINQAITVNGGVQINVELWKWNFRESKFWNVGDVDCDVYILPRNIEVNNKGDLFCYDIWGGRWHNPDKSYKQNTERQLEKDITIKDKLEIVFANTDGWNRCSQKHSITIYELLIKGQREGEFIWDIEDMPGGGCIEIKIKGIPKFDKSK